MKKFILTTLVLACTSVYATNNTNDNDTAVSTSVSTSVAAGNQLTSNTQGGTGGNSAATGGTSNAQGGQGGTSFATGGTSISSGGNSSSTGGASNATGGKSTSTATGGAATGGRSSSFSAGGNATGGVSESVSDSNAVTGASTSSVNNSIMVGCTTNCGANTTDKVISDNTNSTNKEIAAGHDQAARDVANSKIRNTPSMFGPALVSSNDTCMGSTSGSVAAPGLGIGFGTTWVDENCKMLKNSQALWNMGFKAASVALMCNDEKIKAALELTGYVCPTKPAQ